MPLTPYLILNGKAEEALAFYRAALGGNVEIVRYKDAPSEEQGTAELAEQVMHGRLTAANGVALGVMDAPPERGGEPGSNFTLSFETADEAQAREVFDKLAAGGRITWPFGKTFFADAFGMISDKYGATWMVNCRAAVPAAS